MGTGSCGSDCDFVLWNCFHMLPNARQGRKILQTIRQVHIGMLIKFIRVMPVLAACIVSKMLPMK